MKEKTHTGWIIKIVVISVAASIVFTLASTEVLSSAGYAVAVIVLVIFISLGIVFDMLGVAVTSTDEAPFHSMAAHRERGAAESLRLIKNADKVSSFCNDVIGDVSGIVSGSTSTLLAARLAAGLKGYGVIIVALLVSGAVTGLTIGGKAACKSVAINNSVAITLRAGKLINMARFRRRKPQ